MSQSSKENVPRGDHVPGGPNDASVAEMNQKARQGADSAAQLEQGADDKKAGEREEKKGNG